MDVNMVVNSVGFKPLRKFDFENGGFMEKEIQLPAHLAELSNTCIC